MYIESELSSSMLDAAMFEMQGFLYGESDWRPPMLQTNNRRIKNVFRC